MHSLNILYQDDDLMVIDKPFGLVTTPADSITEETVSDILQKEYQINLDRGGVVHRLDKDTSGILLAAKNQVAFDALQDQFRERTIHKSYLALVHQFIPIKGTIHGSIARNPENREKFTVLAGGKEAVTDYELVNRYQMTEDKMLELYPDFNSIQRRKMVKTNYAQFSLVRAFPKTGRTHQIRVHLKHINYPIVGDEKYGGRKIVRLDHRWCKRQFLHAAKISLIHPKTKQKIEFESPLPPDLKESLSFLTPLS
jgi:23S rRNA pseudouridine1911/1915/1917 synthase